MSIIRGGRGHTKAGIRCGDCLVVLLIFLPTMIGGQCWGTNACRARQPTRAA